MAAIKQSVLRASDGNIGLRILVTPKQQVVRLLKFGHGCLGKLDHLILLLDDNFPVPFSLLLCVKQEGVLSFPPGGCIGPKSPGLRFEIIPRDGELHVQLLSLVPFHSLYHQQEEFFQDLSEVFSVDRFPARNQLTLDLFPRQVLDQRLGLPAMMALVLTRTNAVIIMTSTSPTLGTDQTNFFVRVASHGRPEPCPPSHVLFF